MVGTIFATRGFTIAENLSLVFYFVKNTLVLCTYSQQVPPFVRPPAPVLFLNSAGDPIILEQRLLQGKDGF